MEHRWGERIGMDILVKLTAHAFCARHGRLSNLSVSGALVQTDFALRLLSKIQVVIVLPQRIRCEAPIISAYVTRSTKAGIGIEWCKFAPDDITSLLTTLAARYVRPRKPEPLAGIAISRLSLPLLKHGN